MIPNYISILILSILLIDSLNEISHIMIFFEALLIVVNMLIIEFKRGLGID